MIEIDFLAVESEDGPGSKSGDAIAVRYLPNGESRLRVVVVDGGYSAVGNRLVRHVNDRYLTDRVDLVVSTHPDADHINGLIEVVESLEVTELMLHLPWEHHGDVDEYSNLEKIEALYAAAEANGTAVTEPFAGIERYNGTLRVLGPSQTYYQELLAEGVAANVAENTLRASADVFGTLDVKSELSEDALDDTDDTSSRNNSSVILSIEAADEFHIFTGDAGITALDYAADEFERALGANRPDQVEFFQVPHHGSRHNLGPSVLDRWFPTGSAGTTAFISSALADEKHPGVAVLAELRNRGFRIYATEGKNLLHSHDAQQRSEYSEASPA